MILTFRSQEGGCQWLAGRDQKSRMKEEKESRAERFCYIRPDLQEFSRYLHFEDFSFLREDEGGSGWRIRDKERWD